MTTKPGAEALEATRRAVARIRSYGIDGPRPIEEIEALLEHGEAVGPALRTVLQDAGPERLAAAIHLVVLLRRADALDTVRQVAFEQPASLQAKREAVEALRRCGVEPTGDVEERLRCVERVLGGDRESLDEVLSWPAAWSIPAIEEWLKAAVAADVPAVAGALGRNRDLDGSLLDWLGGQETEEAAATLQQYVSAAADRAQVKRARKALHVLRSRGVRVNGPAGEEPGAGFSMALDTTVLDDARAFVTSIDGRGARLVWILWRSAGGGSRLLQSVVDDTVGLCKAEIATVTRKGFREYVDGMRANRTVLVDQVELSHALGLLGAAAQRVRDAGGELPEAYEHWVETVGPDEMPGGTTGLPRIYEQIEAEQLRNDDGLIDASMALLREPHFQSWALEGPPVEAAAQEVLNAETSTLMISDEQRRERMQEALRDAVVACFDDEARRLYRARLEDMATTLWDRGQHDEARQALAAAIGLTEVDDLFRSHAMARALVHRGVWLAYQDRRRAIDAEQARSGLVRP